MKLLTKEIYNKMQVPDQVTDDENAPIIVKFFGGASYRFYVIAAYAIVEGEEQGVKLSDLNGREPVDINLYGYVTGLQEDEWGYTSFNEMATQKFPPFRLSVERDMHFGMKHTVKQVIAKETY